MRSLLRHTIDAAAAVARPAVLIGLGLTVAACASNPNDPYGGWPGNFDRANLAPGRSVACFSDPCNAQYKMPDAGGKTYTVRVNNLVVGQYPASGQVVDLGACYALDSPCRYTIDGLAVPVAVLWVGGYF